MVTGGYAGGMSSGILTNTTATIAVDAATGRPVTGTQLWDATFNGLAIDGPLNAVGAVGDRMIMIRGIGGGRPSNVFGAEGEILVSQELDVPRAMGSQQISVNGNNPTIPRPAHSASTGPWSR
jgi:hypothetical protein